MSAASLSVGREELPGKRGTVLAVAGLMLALFLVALDQTIIGTALPKIIADLNGFTQYAWVTTAYLLASMSMIPVIERSSPPGKDRLPRSRHYNRLRRSTPACPLVGR